jgi:hypothetical protein
MEGFSPTKLWTPLDALRSRFSQNAAALAKRYPDLAASLQSLVFAKPFFILPTGDTLQLGISTGKDITPLRQILPPSVATDMLQKMYPAAACNQPALIAGEDLGWLWNGLYNLPCQTPAAPGHRPPLFFLIRDLERLKVLLHIHDWQTLLADPRVRLYTGETALNDFREAIASEVAIPWPKLSVRVDSSLWPENLMLDQMLAQATAESNRQYLDHIARFRMAYANRNPDSIASQLASGQPLKILGITSRFTTFLQYSMRDWLAAFERLGHTTRLLIEQHDHEACNGLGIAAACADFLPDLVVIIDHYRSELRGIPEQIPSVMWVQDALPNIFRKEAGQSQGPLDYCLGFSRLRMVHEFNYPAERYMPAVIGCDELRFAPRALSPAEESQYACDVSFVSHASTPAEAILQSEIDRNPTPETKRLLHSIFDELRGIYESGSFVTEPIQVQRIIESSLERTRTTIHLDDLPKLVDTFNLRINNALFRHQSLNWLAKLGVDLRLYGRGWEKHPTLSKFARGIADNNTLSTIYRASKISMQITPHGAVHQRMMEGLACGGFFMLRHCPGDMLERHLHLIWNFCISHGIDSDPQLRAVAEPQITSALRAVAQTFQKDPFKMQPPFIETLRASAQEGFIRSAATVWGEDYDAVVYNSADELATKVNAFLADQHERNRIASAMRAVVLARFTYLATSRRLLNFIAHDLAGQSRQKAAA